MKSDRPTTQVAEDNSAQSQGVTLVEEELKRPTNTSSVDTEHDEDTLRKLRHKVDFRIIPIAASIYLFNFLDKVAFNYAAPMGMNQDLKLQGNEFSNTATFFFVAYLIAELPTGFILTKFSASKYLGINVVLWGIATACTAAVTGYRTLLACRVFIGIFEACAVPSLMLIIGRWYNESEQAPRYAFWYCGLGAGQIVVGFLSFGFQHATNSTLQSWRMMFVMLGSITILLGGDVEKAQIFRHLSTDRMDKSQMEFDQKQLAATFKDPQIWLLSLMTILPSISSGVVSSYSATLIRNFGYSPKTGALLNIPSGVVSIASSLITGWGVRRVSYRCLWFIASCLLGMLGGALMSFSPITDKAGRLAGVYLVNCVVPTVMIAYQLTTANTVGHTKRAFSATIMGFSFGVGNIIGPQTFQARDAPEYLPAKITVLITQGTAALLAVVLHGFYATSNRRSARSIRYVY
ncbi:hypothetical protein Q7P37_008260 [Cladosporium fusiforme]